MTRGGTYTLLVELEAPATVAVGALGTHEFEAGWYAYTGSALGPGGFARVERHRELARGERDTRQWHVDYLLGRAEATLVRAVETAADAECAVARRVGSRCEPVAGFGASDCGCDSHLAYAPDRATAEGAVEDAHRAAGVE
jgi:Uri superfamily endonuclease